MTTEERLSRIEEMLARMEERQSGHFARVEEHIARTTALEEAIYGRPGQPGMRTEVALLRATTERFRWLGRTAVGAGIIAATAAIAAWVKKG